MNKGEKRTRAEFDVLERIREEKEKRGWTDYQLAENSNLTQSTLSTWNNRNIEPGIASIEKICNGLGISLSQFFAENATDADLTEDQTRLLDSWKKLSPLQRSAVQALLDSFISS